MTDPLPLRLHRAVSILSRTGDPEAGDAQAACAETAARIVMLEEALPAMLSGKEGAVELGRRGAGRPYPAPAKSEAERSHFGRWPASQPEQ